MDDGCEVRIPQSGLADPTDRDKAIVGNCKIIPGMSGAPVVARVNGNIVVVGFNVGRRYDLTQEPTWLRQTNVMRLIDSQIEQAIAKLGNRP